jgi:hypothetical protein
LETFLVPGNFTQRNEQNMGSSASCSRSTLGT